MPEPLLEVNGLDAFYGDFQALFGVSMRVASGAIVAVIGANGAGKSTLLKSIAGLMGAPPEAIRFDGVGIGGGPAFRTVARGIALVPEGRRLFAGMSVEENLLVAGGRGRRGPWTLARVIETFPQLQEKLKTRATDLSGGQQQATAIARALMTNPRLLILDEATEGLAPVIRGEIWRVLTQLKATGLSILIIDKNVEALAAFADRHYIIEKGRVVWSGSSDELRQSPELQRRYLGV